MEFFKKIFSSKNKTYEQTHENDEQDEMNSMPRDEIFVSNYKKNGGKFFYPNDMDDFNQELIKLLKFLKKDAYVILERSYLHFLQKMNVPVTDELTNDSVLLGGCENLIADSGAIMTTSLHTLNYRNNELPKTRVIIGLSNQIVNSKADALHQINKKYEKYPSNIQTISIFKEPNKNSVDNKWYDTYLFLIEN